jgi:hypothetical protein
MLALRAFYFPAHLDQPTKFFIHFYLLRYFYAGNALASPETPS